MRWEAEVKIKELLPLKVYPFTVKCMGDHSDVYLLTMGRPIRLCLQQVHDSIMNITTTFIPISVSLYWANNFDT